MSSTNGMTSDSRLRSFYARDMICFSHDWTGDPLSKTHLMRLLAQRNRVLWVNSIGYRTPTVSRGDMSRVFRKLAAATKPLQEVEPNLFVLNPIAIPVHGRASVRNLNRSLLRYQVKRAMRKLGFDRPINWTFNPAAAMLAGTLDEDAIVYYCVDEYTALNGVDAAALAEQERGLLRQADLVVASSEALAAAKCGPKGRTLLVRHGVDFDHFRTALDEQTEVPADIARLPGPIIGYFGLMSADWFDVDLLVQLARAMPEASLVLIGKSTMDLSALSALPNVHLLGRKPYASLPGYCKAMNVALIPFPISPLTLSSNPLKAREYLAAGLPVVSTAIPEVTVLPQCRLGYDAAGFIQQVRTALHDKSSRHERSESVRDESWASRLASVEDALIGRLNAGELTKRNIVTQQPAERQAA